MRPTQADIDRYRNAGLWGDETLDDRFQANARRVPERVALIDAPNRSDFTDGAPQRLTYAEVDAAASRTAARIRALGVQPGEIVVYQLPNIVESVILLLACNRAGMVASPLLVQFNGHEIDYVLRQLKPRLFIGARFKTRDLTAEASALCAAAGCMTARVDEITEGPATPVDRGTRDADDLATICWTSGTEGRPKGVMRSSNNWFITARNMLHGASMREGDVILNTRPLVNMAAMSNLVGWLATASTLVMHHPLDMELVVQQIRDERVTMTLMPPAFFVALLKDDALRARADLSSLRLLGTGSASIPPWATDKIEGEFGIEIVNFFGSNEGTSLLSTGRELPDPGLRATHFPRFGRDEFDWPSFPPTQDFESFLIDPESGEEILEPGRPGELRLKGPGIFIGYYGEPELTAKAFDEEGRYRTGDIFEIAGEGEMARFYRFIGRNKEIIVRGGLKISPAELDELAADFPGATEIAFFGCDDDRLGEIVGVAVVPVAGREVTLAEIIAWLKNKQVAIYKLPQHLLTLTALPRNAMFKIQRDRLRELDLEINTKEEIQ
ncbi:class I adenylate-forming enzyme family protein [Pararhodobacter oceanensis]|uniref:class I adenylate-forming enzyme family protein n=1 Tax=Pararhodobacter oceanensis TaxID=2172121 RepID=UPI001401EDF1|nr:class I adenylate-forming enzyme family protein [Pararhodobacter oceanensis]